MSRSFITFIITCVCYTAQAQPGIIHTIAGTGTMGYGGDDSSAIYAKLNNPESLCLDKWDNIYIADAGNHRLRKINALTGIITTIAGDGTYAFGGDGGPAMNAKLWFPEAVFNDTAGNVYIADAGNSRIRKITVSSGIITTVAGNGIVGYAGDNGPATDAKLYGPSGLYVDRLGAIYIADYYNNAVRKVDGTTGIITTIAGNGTMGYSGDNGPATDALLRGPVQVFADNAGNVLIADQDNNAVRKVTTATGIITTIAGTGTAAYGGDNGPATAAGIHMPSGIYVDAQNNIFIAEYGSGVIRKIDAATGVITTVAGTGMPNYCCDGSPATNAQLRCSDVFFDSHGAMIICDYENNRIRRVGTPVGVQPVIGKQKVKIYPNPARDEVLMENAAECDMRICNVAGQEVYRGKLSKNKEIVDIRKLSSGVYVVDVRHSDGRRESVRLVKSEPAAAGRP